MQSKATFEAAETLAEFARLTPEGVEVFREYHEDFVPAVWWEYKVSSGTLLWKINQEFLQEAWEKHFEIGQFELMRLLTSVFDPTSITDVMLRTKSRPAFATVTEMPEEFYPYQKAVLFLMNQKWRARFCNVCRLPFVRGHNQQKSCSEPCLSQNRKKQKRDDHKRHLDVRNRKKRGAYARRKAKRR
jgi:hypothetical protein